MEDMNKQTAILENYIKELGKKRIPFTIENVEREIRNAFVAGEKELAKENKRLTKRICELQSDLSRAKNQIEKMRCCENCKYHSFWGDELKCNYGMKEALQEDKLVECKDMNKWELAE